MDNLLQQQMMNQQLQQQQQQMMDQQQHMLVHQQMMGTRTRPHHKKRGVEVPQTTASNSSILSIDIEEFEREHARVKNEIDAVRKKIERDRAEFDLKWAEFQAR